MSDQLTTAQPATRRQSFKAFWAQSDVPLTVYVAILVSLVVLWIIQEVHTDLTLGLFTELLGAAFTLFIIDTLLVRSKTRRWKVVREHVDYLIARNTHRLRDGLAVRAFGFRPVYNEDLAEVAQRDAIRLQRAELLVDLARLEPERVVERIAEDSLFTQASYDYLNEKAEEFWAILNMKYSEYLEPDMVSSLVQLHTALKDSCAHLRQYRKAEVEPDNADYYQQIGRRGASVSLGEVVRLVNHLKEQGYSEAANLG